jgi:hypothetical protein
MVRENPHAKFLYARYDKLFSEEDLSAAALCTEKGFTLDNLELMEFLTDCGNRYAEQVVKLEHFDDV